MGMDTHVEGFKPPDEKWQQMRAVWEACTAAKIGIPRDVERYFDGEAPDPHGVQISESDLRACGALRDWKDGMRKGREVDVTKLPPDVTVVRFFNSW